MAMINSVSVLTPNGRRQIVNVTPNSTVLQILEEVCKQHDFDPLEYDIRHHSSILDTTMTIQFSRLPNNAQLEMVKAKKIRKESEVLVNIQIESGSRLSGTFLPSTSLWDIVSKLCPDSCGSSKLPTVVYMRQEICGMENLKGTSLRCLGLTNGRALFRFLCKSVEGDVPKQLGVTSKLANFGVASTSHRRDVNDSASTQQSVNKELNAKGKVQKDSLNIKRTTDPDTAVKTSLGQTGKGSPTKDKTPFGKETEKKIESHKGSDKSSVMQYSSMENETTAYKKQCTDTSRVSTFGANSKDIKLVSQEVTINDSSPEDIVKEEIEPRGRNAVIFKQGSHRPSGGDDLPDEFFELTLDDVQNLYRDLKSKRSDVDESPLQTSAVKKLEESKRILNQLNKYKRAVLRIQFPDQIILQGSFSPVETIENVHEFVRSYLQDPSVSFYLYTTPPKEILTPSSRLIEVNCVPCAVLHFGLPDGPQRDIHFLRPELLNELSSLEVATAAAKQSRGLDSTSGKHSVPSTSGVQQSHASTSGTQASKESKVGRSPQESKGNVSEPTSSKDTKHAGNPNGKVPKWFKVGPK